jgi:hypothetical protein
MTAQFAFDFAPSPKKPPPDAVSPPAPPVDKLAEIIIANRFSPNGFILGLNHSLQVPEDMQLGSPWNLPSRLFRFPLEAQQREGKLHIGLMHPLLGDHPFVDLVAKAISPFPIGEQGAPNDYGYSQTRLALWWHAVDLIGHWQNLLETRRFTTPSDIARAVTFGLDYSKLDTAAARQVLSRLRIKEPKDKTRILALLMPPSIVKPDHDAGYWPLNASGPGHQDPNPTAWGRIYGIEAGWFHYPRKTRHLQWSEAGRAMYAKIETPS